MGDGAEKNRRDEQQVVYLSRVDVFWMFQSRRRCTNDQQFEAEQKE